MRKELCKKNIVVGLISGLFVGFLNGFFGGGGGMVVVPILSLIMGLEEREAHATAILTILPISIASAIVYILNCSVNYLDLGLSTVGFMLGGLIGALLLKKIGNTFLRIVFCLIMIVAGIKILV